MTITLKKIEHRGAYRIGVFFAYNPAVNSKLKTLGATYSKTYRCWYFNYSSVDYELLRENFTDIVIDNPTQAVDSNELVAGPVSRDIPPIDEEIARVDAPAGQSSKLPGFGPLAVTREHKAGTTRLAHKLRLKLAEPLGKYWVFGMDYDKEACSKMLKIKGVYWNKQQKAYMAMRIPQVKAQLESILECQGFFPTNFIAKDKPAIGGIIELKPHRENERYMQVYLPNSLVLKEKMKRFSMSKYHMPLRCYLVPATAEVFKAISVHYEPDEVKVQSYLPKGYLKATNMPNRKSFLLTRAKENLLEKVPEAGKEMMIAMIDCMLAENLSDATIKNYGNAFLRFIRDHEYADPARMDYKQIVRYLGGLMEKGLSSSVGNNLVNALNYYYRNVAQMADFAFKLPRPKKEKRIRTVFTENECVQLFGAITNIKHRLYIMLAYGSGLRVGEVATIMWHNILFEEQQIHIYPVGLFKSYGVNYVGLF
jgi:hypothetical protein